jgi:hypothetical protein
MLHAGFLLDIFLEPEDGGDMFLRIIGTTRRYIPEDGNFHNYRCENLKSYKRYITDNYRGKVIILNVEEPIFWDVMPCSLAEV